MGEIATSDRQITLYYGSKNAEAKKALATAQTHGVPIEEINLQKTKLTGTQIAELADRLDVRIEDLINQEHGSYKANFDHHDYSNDDWIKMIQHNPDILKHPIALRGETTIFVRTSTDILHL